MRATGPAPFGQSAYRVRLDWGLDGLRRLAPADVVVVADVLRFSTHVTIALEHDAGSPDANLAGTTSLNGAPVARAAAATGALTFLGGLRNAGAIAAAVRAEQERRRDRVSVTIIPAGELPSDGKPGPLRFAVEDLLGAGAVVAALTDLGIDHASPEASAAGAAFRAMEGALETVIAASGSGRELSVRALDHAVAEAAALNASTLVPVLRGDRFVPARRVG